MIRLRPMLALAFAWATPLLVPAQARAEGLHSVLERHLDRESMPGGVLLVSMPGRRDVVAAGIADRDHNRAITPQSRFYVASVGKMAVAAAILQLVDEGKLDLDDEIAPLVKGIPGIGRLSNVRTARLRQLLDHSSGIPDYLTDAFYERFRTRPERLTPALALPFAYGEKAPFRPGRGHDYSNSNYVLLGAILAGADRTSFDTAVQRRILDRAGMTDTTIGADPRDRRLAHGYADPEDIGEEEDVSLLSWNSPLGDGPLVATAEDLERFLFSLFRDGKLLSPASLALMTKPSKRERDYGLGVELGRDRWGEWIGHSGLEDGFEAEVRFYPARQAALVFVANGNSQSEDSILDQVAEEVFTSNARTKARARLQE